MRLAEASGTPLEIIRAEYLLDAMRARVAIAHAEDAPPFTGYGKRPNGVIRTLVNGSIAFAWTGNA